MPVIVACLRAIVTRRDHRLSPGFLDALDELVRIKGLVCDHGLSQGLSCQALHHSACAWVIPWRCPGVSRQRTGLPKASTTAWVLVLNPPRERPKAWGPAFFGRQRRVGERVPWCYPSAPPPNQDRHCWPQKGAARSPFSPNEKSAIYTIPIPKV